MSESMLTFGQLESGISKDTPVELGADDSIFTNGGTGIWFRYGSLGTKLATNSPRSVSLLGKESTFVKLSRQRKEIQPQNATEEQAKEKVRLGAGSMPFHVQV